MRAIMPVVLPDVLSWRKRRRLDRWDEMWDGDLHMAPAPNVEHQNLESDLEAYLGEHWARVSRGKVLHQVNVASSGGWPNNFRNPDLILLSRQRMDINRGDYLEGAPDIVVEIESPGDETRQKLPFYAELGVPEVWIIDRDSKEPEIYLLRGQKHRRQRSSANG